jgi:hypothetical protein
MHPQGLILISLLILASCSQIKPISEKATLAASALFEQFESVFFSDSRVLLDTGKFDALSPNEVNALRRPYTYLLGSVSMLGQEATEQMLESSEAVLVGAKDFRPPKGLGPVRSQRCYVVVLRKQRLLLPFMRRKPFALHNYIQKGPVAFHSGTSIWSWSVELGEFGEGDPRPSTIYGAQLGDSYLILSNSLQILQTLAENLLSVSNAARAVNEMRDWPSFSQHQVWGYRRYAHAEIHDKAAAGLLDVTTGAQALIFFADIMNKRAVIRLHCDVADEGTPAKINARAILPRLKSGEGPFWTTAFPLNGNEEVQERILFVMGLFGFGAYL